ncbi:hypothetical protein B7H23_10790 [Notoacmeibacter marinus]|uniref:Uncharacterized protein n=1 Tax=Notoacmeibacter marinus TaxID=1876515 RepID=A0A231UXH4_9HYPH|nr:hypothetical protein B7H23_10790 [Notoacmeibacter marinus]
MIVLPDLAKDCRAHSKKAAPDISMATSSKLPASRMHADRLASQRRHQFPVSMRGVFMSCLIGRAVALVYRL